MMQSLGDLPQQQNNQNFDFSFQGYEVMQAGFRDQPGQTLKLAPLGSSGFRVLGQLLHVKLKESDLKMVQTSGKNFFDMLDIQQRETFFQTVCGHLKIFFIVFSKFN